MHGRVRVSVSAEKEKEADHQERAALQKRVSLYSQLQSNVLQYHKEKRYTTDTLQQSAKFLELNPDVHTVWNFRKCAFQHQFAAVGEDEAAHKKLAEEELRLVEKALRNNPKSYGAWHHRKWIVSKGLTPVKREFELLAMLLGLDNRNFHGWDYRRFAVQFSARSAEMELQYSMEKINEDPRNYSAWHSRSQLLRQIHKVEEGMGAVLDSSVIKTEYELVRQALWTAPDDQSGFMYYQWLLGHTVEPQMPSLLATWPASGISVSIQEDGQIQLLLLFSAPVIGVDENTVGIDYVNEGAEVNFSGKVVENMGWKSLAGTSGGSKCWVRIVKVEEGDNIGIRSNQSVRLKLLVGHCTGIKSSSGVSLQDSVQVLFNVVGRKSSWDGMKAWSERETGWWPSERQEGDKEWERVALPADVMGENSSEGKACKVEDKLDSWRREVLLEEISMCKELLAEETESVKWPTLTLVRLLLALRMVSDFPLPTTLHTPEVLSLYRQLEELDIDHKEYYKDQLGKLRLQEALASIDSLLERWQSPVGSNGGSLEGTEEEDTQRKEGWLLLSHLELGEIDEVHRLLWVKQLDLSNNRLRSAHGLESLQLLTCLDLSHNRISHGSAIAPLALLPRLRFLNLSHNLIGSCKNDMHRYCSSCVTANLSLQTSENIIGKSGEKMGGDKDLEAWNGGSSVNEILRGFQVLTIAVLDLRGNAVTRESSYFTTLKGFMPSLLALDGENII